MWKVLVVDDNVINRELLIEVLDGHAVCDQAVDGKDAIRQYEQALVNGEAYDMILLDIAMPEVDGLGFLKFVRTTESAAGVPTGSGVPVIMITAFERSFMDAFNGGCDDYIVKPIDAGVLLQKMRAMLAGR
jgi:CheY-like chemotaxis protein